MMGAFFFNRSRPPAHNDTDYSQVFAVPENEPWWCAVHRVLDEAEKETVQGARDYIKDTNRVLSAVGAGEGIELVRRKLLDLRDQSLRRNIRGGESNAIRTGNAQVQGGGVAQRL